jgi:hypothetical protein
MFHHLSSSLSTLYWEPGDVVRADYTFEEPIPGDEVQVAVFPLRSRPEEVRFLAPGRTGGIPEHVDPDENG